MKQISSSQALKLAKSYHEKGEIRQAEQVYSALLEIDQHHAEATHNLGIIKLSRGNTEEGLNLVRKSIELDRTNPSFHNNLGEIYRKMGQLEQAELHIAAALELNPRYSAAYSNMGLLCMGKGENEKAKACFAEALSIDPKNIQALINTGNLFRSEGQFENALECYEAVLEISENSAVGLKGAAHTCLEAGEYSSAAKYFSRLVTAYPELNRDKVNLALITLRNKDFRKGFQLFENRFKYQDIMEGDAENLWRGTGQGGKTLYIYSESHELTTPSDTVLFARYLYDMEKYNCGKIIFRVQPEIFNLIKDNMPENIEVSAEPPAEFDLQIPLLSMPMVLNARAKTIPKSEGYIKADKKMSEDFAGQIDTDKTKIGVFAEQTAGFEPDAFSALSEKYALYSMGADFEGVKNIDADAADPSQMAAFIDSMDMVITADGLPAHIAGAMGKKTLLLLDTMHDWRWFTAKTGKACEWYQCMVFYVREKDQTWKEFVSSVRI